MGVGERIILKKEAAIFFYSIFYLTTILGVAKSRYKFACRDAFLGDRVSTN